MTTPTRISYSKEELQDAFDAFSDAQRKLYNYRQDELDIRGGFFRRFLNEQFAKGDRA